MRFPRHAEVRLGALEHIITDGPFPEFKYLLPTLKEWRQEIINYFDYRITNGFAEGKNTAPKPSRGWPTVPRICIVND